MTCVKCKAEVDDELFVSELRVCPKCGYHHAMSAKERLSLIVDEGSFIEYDTGLYSLNPLEFPEYEEKLERARIATSLPYEMLTGAGKIGGYNTDIGIADMAFMMGSMGSVIGEKLTRMIERATQKRLPAIIISAFGGGMRMQEGTISLMQMAKTAAACARHHEAGLFYISVITHPTMGGAAASFASLGDVILAEPGAWIGFAGPRARASIGEKLPEGFQTAEFMLEHGMLDLIVHRRQMRKALIDLLDFCVK